MDKQGRSHYRDQRCGNCGAVFGTSLLELEIAPVVEDAEAIVALSRTGGKQSYAKRAGKA